MPLRSRLRRAFTRASHDDPHLTKAQKKNAKCDPNVYQPGEKMPPLKYRRPVAPEHKAHLESFSFAKAWRPRSAQSIYSPMGTRMPSRKSSFQSFGRRSVRSVNRRSQSKSRAGDDGGTNDSGFGASLSDERPEQLREHSDEEGDVTNVGLSRNPTEDPRRPRKSSSIHCSQSLKSSSSPPPTSDRVALSLASPKLDAPFDPDELEQALQKTTLDITRKESDRSGHTSPYHDFDDPPMRPRERLIVFNDTHIFETPHDDPVRSGTY